MANEMTHDEWVAKLRDVASRDAAAATLTKMEAEGASEDELNDAALSLAAQQLGVKRMETWATAEAGKPGRLSLTPSYNGDRYGEGDKLLALLVERNTWGHQIDPATTLRETFVTGVPVQPSVHLTKAQFVELIRFGLDVFGIDIDGDL